jgi:hypothetical protein
VTDYHRRVVKMFTGLLLLAGACRSPEPATTPPSSQSTIGSDPVARDTLHIPAAGPFSLPATWTSCATDDNCTIASLGCCDETPVNRDHVAATRAALHASGRPYCAPKDACGPSASGTWDGEGGKCDAGACRMPLWP